MCKNSDEALNYRCFVVGLILFMSMGIILGLGIGKDSAKTRYIQKIIEPNIQKALGANPYKITHKSLEVDDTKGQMFVLFKLKSDINPNKDLLIEIYNAHPDALPSVGDIVEVYAKIDKKDWDPLEHTLETILDIKR